MTPCGAQPSILLGGALCRDGPSFSCGSNPMQGETLRSKGVRPEDPVGGAAVRVRKVEAASPLRNGPSRVHVCGGVYHA